MKIKKKQFGKNGSIWEKWFQKLSTEQRTYALNNPQWAHKQFLKYIEQRQLTLV